MPIMRRSGTDRGDNREPGIRPTQTDDENTAMSGSGTAELRFCLRSDTPLASRPGRPPRLGGPRRFGNTASLDAQPRQLLAPDRQRWGV